MESQKDEEENQNVLADWFSKHHDLKDEIDSLIMSIQPKIVENIRRIDEGRMQLQALKIQKRKLANFCKTTMEKNCSDVDNKMSTDWVNSEVKQETLKEDIKEAEGATTLKRIDYLKTEKEFREKRNRIDDYLASVIKKYKEDMKQRQDICDKLTGKFNKQMEALEGLTVKYDAQEIKYVSLMNEKRNYENEIWEARLLEVRRKIAARKLQRIYRTHLTLLITSGKKGKKGKGKKKK